MTEYNAENVRELEAWIAEKLFCEVVELIEDEYCFNTGTDEGDMAFRVLHYLSDSNKWDKVVNILTGMGWSVRQDQCKGYGILGLDSSRRKGTDAISYYDYYWESFNYTHEEARFHALTHAKNKIEEVVDG